jgi:hypothetical protein
VRGNPISIYSTIGLVCGGTSSAVQAVLTHQSALFVLGAAGLGSAIGVLVGGLYGYIKLRRAAKKP